MVRPCRAETPEVKALDDHLKGGKQVQMLHWPFVFEERLLERTLTYIRENNLSPHQSFCDLGKCPVEVTVKALCDVCTFARATSFPNPLHLTILPSHLKACLNFSGWAASGKFYFSLR